MAGIRNPKPLAPNVKIANNDGTPTREFHEWLSKQYEHLASPGTESDFRPTEAALPAAGVVGRIVATMSIKNAAPPVTYVLGDNPANIKVAFTGADLKTTVNPAGAVGTYSIGIRASDADGRAYNGVLRVELT